MGETRLLTGFRDLDTERSIVEAAGCRFRAAQGRSPEEGVDAARKADVLRVQWTPVTAEVMASLLRCRRSVRYGIGVDNLDVAAAWSREISVCNVPDYCVDEVADHTLAFARQLPATHSRILRGEWKITFACVGLGRIALVVWSRAAAFGFRLAGYAPLSSTQPLPDAAHGIWMKMSLSLRPTCFPWIYRSTNRRGILPGTTGCAACGPDRSWSTFLAGRSSTPEPWRAAFRRVHSGTSAWTCSKQSRPKAHIRYERRRTSCSRLTPSSLAPPACLVSSDSPPRKRSD